MIIANLMSGCGSGGGLFVCLYVCMTVSVPFRVNGMSERQD